MSRHNYLKFVQMAICQTPKSPDVIIRQLDPCR